MTYWELFKAFGLKSQNLAPKSIEGNYNLVIKGNEIVLIDNVSGDTVNARCDKEDRFNFGGGMNLAMERMVEKKLKAAANDIKVGDAIFVTNNEKSYTTAINWFKNNGLSVEIMTKYAYGTTPENGTMGTVEVIDDEGYVLFKTPFDWKKGEQYFLMNKAGVKKAIS